MSRIGKLPVELPSGVSANINGAKVTITGPKGELTKEFNKYVLISLDDNRITVHPNDKSIHANAMTGTARSIIDSMVKGVVSPYSKNLIISGVGFKAILKGDILDLSLGYSHDILYKIPAGINIVVTENTKVKVEGIDKQLVGQVAADIKSYYPVEPYKAKGVTIVGDFVLRKQGKKTG